VPFSGSVFEEQGVGALRRANLYALSPRRSKQSPGNVVNAGFGIGYLLLAYQKPLLLARLVDRLNSAESAFFIHIDKRREIIPFEDALRNIPSARITFVRREVPAWGTLGAVRATLNGLRAALNSSPRPDYLVFLSGQDYPIKSTKYVREFFERNRDRNFIDFHDATEERYQPSLVRVDHYHFRFLGRYLQYPWGYTRKKLLGRIYESVFGLRFRMPRVFPAGLEPYFGEATWNLSIEAAKYIVDFVDERSDFMRFHRYTHCVDEVFYQTILANARNGRIRESLVNDCLRYIKWLPGRNHPEILTVDDFEALTHSDKLFARKFDMDVDSRILDMLDARAEKES
jgi:hypothetical protein